jgi:hypothetical protein
MGRFLSPDWSAKVAPVPYAKLDDPQSLNLYSYVRNNPLSRIDADGHIDWCAGKNAGSLACGVQTAWNQAHDIVTNYANGDFGPLPPKSLAEHKTVKAPGTPKWHWGQKSGSMDLKIDNIQIQHAGTGYSGHGTNVNNPLADDVGDKGKPNWGPTPAGDYQIGPAYNNPKTGPMSMNLTPDDPNSVYGRGPFLIHPPEIGERIGIDPPISSEGCQVLGPAARQIVASSGVTDEVVDPQ